VKRGSDFGGFDLIGAFDVLEPIEQPCF